MNTLVYVKFIFICCYKVQNELHKKSLLLLIMKKILSIFVALIKTLGLKILYW